MTNKTLKLVSFILACVMLAVAIAIIVCLYVGDGPIVQPAPDDGNGGDGTSDGDTDSSAAANAFGFAIAAAMLLALLLPVFFAHVGTTVATTVLSARQYFCNKNRAVAMLVLNIIQALAYGFLSLVSMLDSPLLKPLFHVFFYVTFLLSVAAIVLDILVLKTNKVQPNVDDCV